MTIGFYKNGSRRISNGFTLLEIIVSISIIAVVLPAIYRMHFQTISTNQVARFHVIAPLLAQKRMALIERISFTDVANESGDFGDNFPGFTWSVSISDVESEILGNVANDLKKLDVTVSFNDEMTYSIRTYRFIR